MRNLKNIIIGTAIAGATFLGGYAIGKHTGREEGSRNERQMTLENLEMRRYDVLQDAKFAKSLKEQDEILKESACIGYTLNFLEPGYDSKKLEAKK